MRLATNLGSTGRGIHQGVTKGDSCDHLRPLCAPRHSNVHCGELPAWLRRHGYMIFLLVSDLRPSLLSRHVNVFDGSSTCNLLWDWRPCNNNIGHCWSRALRHIQVLL